jgi:hypothetical protein
MFSSCFQYITPFLTVVLGPALGGPSIHEHRSTFCADTCTLSVHIYYNPHSNELKFYEDARYIAERGSD